LFYDVEMSDPEHKLEYGLQVMLDILTDYLGNAATRGEWIAALQQRFTSRNGKLRRGWSDDTIDRRIKKLEQMSLIAGGRGREVYFSVVDVDDPGTSSASIRKLSAKESFLDALEAAKLQLL
jgi:hypothetical protein